MSKYEKRVRELEAAGLTRSDAQGVVDAEARFPGLNAPTADARTKARDLADRQRILNNLYTRMNLSLVPTADLSRIHDALLAAGALITERRS